MRRDDTLLVCVASKHVATLRRTRGGLALDYEPTVIATHGLGAVCLSMSLPVTNKRIEGPRVEWWAEGLLPEGEARTVLEDQFAVRRVIGAAGGLGHYAVQIAGSFGYKVVGVDIGEDRLEFARSLGAHAVFSPDEAVDAVQSFGGVDACLVFSALLAGFDLGLQMLRRGGLFVAVGIPASSEGNL